jgi:murein lipoprotein
MNKNLITVAKISAIALSLVLASGCATTKYVDDAKAQAMAAADAAKASAAQAQSTADAAKASADQANTCCTQTNEKIDRMFKKSMNK